MTIILTCYNRRNKTLACIRSLLKGNPTLQLHFVVVDDNSTDSTAECLQQEFGDNVTILKGNGELFYSGGMRKGIEYVKRSAGNLDFVMLVNDDVEFYPHIIEKMLRQVQRGRVLVGATQDSGGNMSYGGIKYGQGIKYHMTGLGEYGDTFNANCVLIPADVFLATENIDPIYSHSLGDFDYGLSISRAGYKIRTYEEYVGRCEDNPIEGTWRDNRLPRARRIQLKEQKKGVPLKEWFYFLRKNFGLPYAVFYSLTPYVRILVGK